MGESSYEHEFLFVLGNGASIASTDQETKRILKHYLSMSNFIDVMNELCKGNYFEFIGIEDNFIYSHSFNQAVERINDFSIKKNERDIVKLLARLFEDKKNIDISDLQAYADNVAPILYEIKSFIGAVYYTVAAYYKNSNDEYFDRLWKVVQEHNSPVVSLNWDFNFENVVFRKTGISMKHFYSKFIFDNLHPDEKKTSYNSIVNILKPHGSLNWYFINESLNYYLHISDYLPGGNFPEFVFNYLSFLIPFVAERDKATFFNGNFGGKKNAILNDIESKIKKYSMSTRTLVIIGYSFPEEDENIRKMFIENRFENVRVLDENEEVSKRIARYFPEATIIFKKDGFADILNWDVGAGFKPART